MAQSSSATTGRSRLHLFLLPLVASVAVLPLLIYGPSCGHDLSFHLLSWLDAARQISAGNLHPHWAYTPAYGAGEPRFVFYPPLSWTLGAALTLLLQHLPFVDPGRAFSLAPILFTWIALCSAGLAAHTLVRRYTTPAAALLASALYLSNPYTLFTAYERTAFSELLAATWIPLLLLAVLPRPSHSPTPASPVPSAPALPPSPSIPFLAGTVALLWLTNAPAAVIGSYAIAVLAIAQLLYFAWKRHPAAALLKRAASFTAGASLGLALAAFYIVPAALEQRWVQIAMATIPGMRVSENTLFHPGGDPAHQQVLHTASLLAISLLAVTSAALLYAFTQSRVAFRRSPDATPPETPPLAPPPPPSMSPPPTSPPFPVPCPLFPGCSPSPEQPPAPSPAPSPRRSTTPPLLALLATLTATIALLLTPVSAPVWRYGPELAFLQFPWRLLALLAAVCALSLALALRSLRLRPQVLTAAAILLPAALIVAAYRPFHQICETGDSPRDQLALFSSAAGSEPTDEYTPVTADNDSLEQHNPPFRLSANNPAPTQPAPNPQPAAGPSPAHLDLDLPAPRQLVLNLRDYPAWLILRNGVPVLERIERDDGLVAFNLPPGHSHIDISYRSTPDQKAGSAISLIALILFLASLFAPAALRRWRHPSPHARERPPSRR